MGHCPKRCPLYISPPEAPHTHTVVVVLTRNAPSRCWLSLCTTANNHKVNIIIITVVNIIITVITTTTTIIISVSPVPVSTVLTSGRLLKNSSTVRIQI